MARSKSETGEFVGRKLERRIVELVQGALEASLAPTPDWLVRPGRNECREAWDTVRQIYRSLTALELPTVMRSVEWREVDAVLVTGSQSRILEVDERQHFNGFRADTLRQYPEHTPVAFDRHEWMRLSMAKRTLERGGFAEPRPPLFPGANGRHKQRAFRDALCDVLPPLHGFAPTLRINAFEVRSWIWLPEATAQMQDLLCRRLNTAL